MKNRKRSREILNIYDRRYKKTEKGREAVKRNSQKRRARKNNLKVVEGFNCKDIFLRDYYICSICGLPINPLLKHPDRYAATLEHKFALSRGGEHSKDNCAPSHYICNMRKGAKDIQPNFGGECI